MPDERPHIILIMTDQQKASATGLHHPTGARTPNWQRLAASGVTFDHAYATSPICTPSRATLMTGTNPLVHRVLCHQNHAPPNLPQLPELLTAAGYHCIGAGHYEHGRSLDRGWADQIEMTGTPALERALKSQYQAGSRDVGWSAGEHALAPEQAHAAVLNDEVTEALDRVDPDTTPLFLHVAYIEPHAPYFAPSGSLDGIDPASLSLPPFGQLDDRPDWHARALEDFAYAQATEDDYRRMLAAYHALIEYSDAQIGRLLDTLDQRGILDNAWVILCSDHGDYAGEKGFCTKSETPYECLLHVPLVIRGPGGRWRPGERFGELVELTDLFSTMLAMAGCAVPEQAEGHDLLARLADTSGAPWRDVVCSAVGAYHGSLKTTMPWGLPESGRHAGIVRGARNHHYSYIRDPDYGEEAYDLTADPWELVNLTQKPNALPDGIQRLRDQLHAWEQRSAVHRSRLGVIEGDRNFNEQPPSNITSR